ncbi:MAG: hypothetical protein EOM25_08240, partial [Deltaproteobacteria bacterium]|nr:hypothetical protein [Deltaproteobacteria bacterium]
MAIIPLDALKNIRFELGRITLKEIDLQDCPRIAEIALAVARKATRDIQAAGHPLPLLEMHGLGHLYDWKHVSDDWLFCPYANLGQPFDTAARRYYERAAKARTLSPRDIVRLVI